MADSSDTLEILLGPTAVQPVHSVPSLGVRTFKHFPLTFARQGKVFEVAYSKVAMVVVTIPRNRQRAEDTAERLASQLHLEPEHIAIVLGIDRLVHHFPGKFALLYFYRDILLPGLRSASLSNSRTNLDCRGRCALCGWHLSSTLHRAGAKNF